MNLMNHRKLHLLATTCLALLALAIVAGCGGDGDGNGNGDNLIANPGFEDGASGWQTRSDSLVVSEEQAASGNASGLLEMRATADSPTTLNFTAFQEFTVDKIPERMTAEYFVDNWVRGTENQYIQVSVIITGSGPGMPECPPGHPCPNIQLRYILGGVTREPVGVANAQFIFVGGEEPPLGEWTHFETDVLFDAAEYWGTLPSVIEKVRVQFEVRYDSRDLDEAPLEADVYLDDVYLGPR